MKKLVFLSFLFLYPLFVSAQDIHIDVVGESIAEELTTRTNGYINFTDSSDDGVHAVRIALPENTSFDNVRSDVSSFINEYSDIEVISAWRKQEDSEDLYMMWLMIEEDEPYRFLLSYTTGYLLLGWGF